METGVRKTLEGYQAWFKIGNQTFYLDDCVEDNDEESLECAQFMERMLKVAFKKEPVKDKDNYDYLRGFADGYGGEEPCGVFPEGLSNINEVWDKIYEIKDKNKAS